jgi:NAD(P)-dependent dehydrogenase (short-subunit alcohol dehydrogenase family)
MVEMNAFSLNGRFILLTGATGHLGSAMLKAIISAGANVIAVGRNKQSLESVIDSLPKESRQRCHMLIADISTTAGTESMCIQILKRFKALHGIVNNAYSGRVGAWHTIMAEDFAQASQMNIVAPFMIVKELLPILTKNASEFAGGASIVNIASMYGSVSPDPSIYGQSGQNNPVHYGASKSGMIQMTKYLACHVAEQKIRFNCISPGPFPNLKHGNLPVKFQARLSKKVPMARVGSPEEVAWPVVFLLSDASSFVNGANLPVDGGWTSW